MTELPKWKPRESEGFYLGHPTLYGCSVALVLNIRTGDIYPQYHVVFYGNFSTVDHTRKVTVLGNWKNLVEEHSYLSMN